MTTGLLHRLATGLPRFARNDGERVFAQIPVTARSEATRQSMDCFVPRNDGERIFARNDSERVFARIPVTARSEATRQSMDCFVPRNDGDMGLARNDGDMGLACHDGDKCLACNDVETGVLRGDTLIPVTARSEATWQSMDCFVPRNDCQALRHCEERSDVAVHGWLGASRRLAWATSPRSAQ
jgi:hypothetical protein